MLAVRLNVKTHSLSVDEVPTPEPGPGQVRIEVAAAGVCLSDVHLVDGSLSPLFLQGDTVTLGHEVSGTVEALGPGVTGVSEGQRVLLQAGEEREGVVFTRGVDYDGGWAQFALAAADTVVPIPDSLPFDQAAILPDAVSTPWAAITATAQVRAGEAVGVWGAGGLGAHAVQLLRLAGAAPIIAVDPLPAARERASEFGADLALDSADADLPRRVREANGGRGLAAAFDFAGVAAVREQAVGCLDVRGRLVLVGLTDKPLTITNGTAFSYFQQQVRGHYGSEPQHLTELVNLVAHRRIDFGRSITDVLPLDKAPEAVDRLIRKEGNPIRLVLRP
ncbi:D-arabinose 1-dehydrogenase-like Zn-dependent alcohol dehydrogenase [Saccharothrix tamanrassetensis]|uniref:D-arabinose 1-dehydrogenase-like Zn-dependent alcohol dehydrogenase n=1 Tax=Saccharothrix tamanrassetensis TaxID=1051531 RepID=A0A841C9T5_9PSEU|nr:zinc-binding dehydrogenase [Saccharothrix tamanrassetensis]MBB5953703.1 D-arabinose 1-dehydrogenase-like Zn-dependent alcohol dehydrogenase [Saccharothrix tamanrassetensis]